MKTLTIVIGLDGAGFELIQNWLKEGKLPNLKRMMDEGCSADLESCLPPVTSPNWKCYSTGKNPGKLGIFWWENIDLENRKVYFPIDRVNTSKETWDFIGENGGRVGIINMPLTYPPKNVNGFLIAGGSFAKEHGYTYPPELEVELKEAFDYQVHLRKKHLIGKENEKAVDEALEVIESRFRVAKKLLLENALDFLHVTTFYINALHHNFWDNRYTEEAWKLIDKNIGVLLKEIKNRGNVFIISDHGSNKIDQVFYINNWLAKEGYLELRSNIKLSNLLYSYGVSRQTLNRLFRKPLLKIFSPLLRHLVPNKIMGFFPSEAGTIDQSNKTDKINWDKTKAIASGQGPLYINLEGKGKERVREELIEKLENLRNPKTGKNIARKVYRKEEIYSGKYLAEAPDLIIDQNPGTHIRGGIGVGKEDVFMEPRGWKAENKRQGIFIAYGPAIKRGKRLEKVSILDLAPTILHLMNIPIPKDMDGRVLMETFEQESEPAKRKVKYQKVENYKTEKEKDRIKQIVKSIKQSGRLR